MFAELLVFSCGGSDQDKPKRFSFQDQMELNAKEGESDLLAVELENTGIGPIKTYELTESVNLELAEKGKSLYQEKCTACHK
jgi:cytochrome c